MKEYLAELLEDWTTPLHPDIVFGLICGFVSISFVFVTMVIIAAFSR